MDELERMRKELDEIDAGIVRLFEQRMAVTSRVGRYKQENGLPVLDSRRQREVLESKAALLEDKSIRILIWGSGDELENLKARVRAEGIRNVSFKGRAEKKQIPAILAGGDALFLDAFDERVSRYGISSNKLFEYFASGKPILMCALAGHNPAARFDCSLTYAATPEGVAETIRAARSLTPERREKMRQGALAAARAYSYDALSEKLNCVVEGKL